VGAALYTNMQIKSSFLPRHHCFKDLRHHHRRAEAGGSSNDYARIGIIGHLSACVTVANVRLPGYNVFRLTQSCASNAQALRKRHLPLSRSSSAVLVVNCANVLAPVSHNAALGWRQRISFGSISWADDFQPFPGPSL
jgi:hypothetical protein